MKIWLKERRVHLGMMRVYYTYQDAFHKYAIVSHFANNENECFVRLLNSLHETIDKSWFDNVNDALKYAEDKMKYKEYKALIFNENVKAFFNKKLYFYNNQFELIDTFRNVEHFMRQMNVKISYVESIFVARRDHIPPNEKRINLLSPVKFQQP